MSVSVKHQTEPCKASSGTARLPTLREKMTSRVAARAHEMEGPAGCGTDRLTDLLTTRCGTGETAWDVDDGHGPYSLLSETRRDTRDVGDVRRLAHNPEVAGSNPAPATSFRRPGPFPSGERAFCVSGTVAKRVAATGLRAARQRDGGDGVTRDETAWTWWTLPPAIAGCLAQKYRRRTGAQAGPARTRTQAGMRLGGATTHRGRKQMRPVR